MRARAAARWARRAYDEKDDCPNTTAIMARSDPTTHTSGHRRGTRRARRVRAASGLRRDRCARLSERIIRGQPYRRGMAAASHPAAVRRAAPSVHREALQQPAQRRAPARDLRMRGLRFGPVLLDHEVRQWHRLAELLESPGQRRTRADRQHCGHVTHRGTLPSLRRPPRPRLQRWPPADRPALLHERRGDDLPSLA